jgi:hypothetical protein
MLKDKLKTSKQAMAFINLDLSSSIEKIDLSDG